MATSQVDGLVLFEDTTGLEIKEATGSGLVKITSGVASVVTAPSGAVVGTTDTQTLSAKTLTAPVIADFTNAAHDHGDADDGGALVAAALPAMVGDSGSGGTKGAAPAPGAGDAAAGKYLKASGAWDVPAGSGTGDVVGPASAVASEIVLFDGTTGKLVKSGTGTGFVKVASGVMAAPAAGVTEAELTIADNTTRDVSTSAHGFAPKAPNDAAKFLRGDASWAVPAGGTSNIVPAYVAGSYYDLATLFLLAAGTAALGINTHFAVPFYCQDATTWDRIAINVTTFGASGNARLGIYAFTAGAPGALILDAGAVAAGSNGEKVITISQALAADTWYFLTCVLDVAATLTSFATAGIGIRGTAGPATNPVAGCNKAFTYAALPDPFGALAGSTNNVPRIMLRAS